MSNHATTKIIDYHDRYARETVMMWRASMEKAIGVKDLHSIEDQVEFLRSTLTRDHKVYLAIDDQTRAVVGLMAIKGSELNQLYIHNEYQRAGIGTRLLALAKELSPEKLSLYTFEVNKPAQAFYERHGFRVVGRGFENVENLPDIKYEWTPQR